MCWQSKVLFSSNAHAVPFKRFVRVASEGRRRVSVGPHDAAELSPTCTFRVYYVLILEQQFDSESACHKVEGFGRIVCRPLCLLPFVYESM